MYQSWYRLLRSSYICNRLWEHSRRRQVCSVHSDVQRCSTDILGTCRFFHISRCSHCICTRHKPDLENWPNSCTSLFPGYKFDRSPYNHILKRTSYDNKRKVSRYIIIQQKFPKYSFNVFCIENRTHSRNIVCNCNSSNFRYSQQLLKFIHFKEYN